MPPHIVPLHIVIDVRRIRDFGIGTYIRNLTRALSALDRENRYTLLARPSELEQLERLGPNFHPVAIAPTPPMLPLAPTACSTSPT